MDMKVRSCSRSTRAKKVRLQKRLSVYAEDRNMLAGWKQKKTADVQAILLDLKTFRVSLCSKRTDVTNDTLETAIAVISSLKSVEGINHSREESVLTSNGYIGKKAPRALPS